MASHLKAKRSKGQAKVIFVMGSFSSGFVIHAFQKNLCSLLLSLRQSSFIALKTNLVVGGWWWW